MMNSTDISMFGLSDNANSNIDGHSYCRTVSITTNRNSKSELTGQRHSHPQFLCEMISKAMTLQKLGIFSLKSVSVLMTARPVELNGFGLKSK